MSDNSQSGYVWIALLPTLIFSLLDAYYLSQERGFRRTYNSFLKKLHGSLATSKDLYIIRITKNNEDGFKDFFEALFSFSISPFYLILATAVFISHYLIS